VRPVTILALETSCDETALALLQASGGISAPKFKILKAAVASQIDMHREFGGVVPNIAKREHLKNLPIIYKKIFGAPANEAKLWAKIDLIAVTAGPGLEPALWTGIEFAKRLAAEHKRPLIAANHLEGHLYSFLLPGTKRLGKGPLFPAVALIVSGGHTILLKMDDLAHWKKLGETVDDAAGEAYDKVARILGLPYPGGPEIERLAKQGDPNAVAFPRPMLNQKNYQFSYSGLKTSVLYYLRDHPEANKADIAASFAAAATDVLVLKSMRAVREFGARSILLSGGVAANALLRAKLAKEAKKAKVSFLVADRGYNTDNAVMIGAAAYMNHLRGKRSRPGGLEARGQLGI
jgi:N6-L-threonylcarbamoyladenine synthase